MRIINILEIVNGTSSKIKSFPIHEEQLSEEVIKDVENLFIKMLENQESKFNKTLTNEEKDFFLDEGCYDNKNGYELYIIWSEIN